MEEIFKPVPFEKYCDYYQISNWGSLVRVRDRLGNPMQPRTLTGHIDRKNKLATKLTLEGIRKTISVKRAVYSAFVGPISHNDVVRNKDRNPSHNHVDNLELTDKKGVILDTLRNGNLNCSHITPETALAIRKEAEQLRKKYNLSHQHFKRIVLYESWAWLTGEIKV